MSSSWSRVMSSHAISVTQWVIRRQIWTMFGWQWLWFVSQWSAAELCYRFAVFAQMLSDRPLSRCVSANKKAELALEHSWWRLKTTLVTANYWTSDANQIPTSGLLCDSGVHSRSWSDPSSASHAQRKYGPYCWGSTADCSPVPVQASVSFRGGVKAEETVWRLAANDRSRRRWQAMRRQNLNWLLVRGVWCGKSLPVSDRVSHVLLGSSWHTICVGIHTSLNASIDQLGEHNLKKIEALSLNIELVILVIW